MAGLVRYREMFVINISYIDNETTGECDLESGQSSYSYFFRFLCSYLCVVFGGPIRSLHYEGILQSYSRIFVPPLSHNPTDSPSSRPPRFHLLEMENY